MSDDTKRKNLVDTIRKRTPEERIQLLKRLKELEEEKIKELEQKKKKEIEELEKKSKEVEKEISEDIKESIDELASIESEKRLNENKIKFAEEQLLRLTSNPQSFDYNTIIDKLQSSNKDDLNDAYNAIKEGTITGQVLKEKTFDYNTLKQIKDAAEALPVNTDGIKEKINYIIDQAFSTIKKYEK